MKARKYRVLFTKRFHKDYSKLPLEIQTKANEQIKKLAKGDFSYPSLRTKKIEGEEKVWEASVTMNYRIIFELDANHISFFKIGPHDIL